MNALDTHWMEGIATVFRFDTLLGSLGHVQQARWVQIQSSVGKRNQACAMTERILVAEDEPASALDPIATLRIEELMRELARDYTIIVVTHNMQQAARVSDYTAFFNMDENRAGVLVEYGRTDQIFTNPQDRRTEDYITGRFG